MDLHGLCASNRLFMDFFSFSSVIWPSKPEGTTGNMNINIFFDHSSVIWCSNNSLTMLIKLRGIPRKGRISRRVESKEELCHSISMGYGAHIPLNICREVDDWEAEVMARHRSMQPMRQWIPHYWRMRNVLTQLLWKCDCAPSLSTFSDSNNSTS